MPMEDLFWNILPGMRNHFLGSLRRMLLSMGLSEGAALWPVPEPDKDAERERDPVKPDSQQ